jgi:hypothetical protein
MRSQIYLIARRLPIFQMNETISNDVCDSEGRRSQTADDSELAWMCSRFQHNEGRRVVVDTQDLAYVRSRQACDAQFYYGSR